MASHVKAGYWFCGHHSLLVAEIRSDLFTHLYAGFAKVKPDTGGVTFPIEYKETFEKFTTTVRRRNPDAKTLLSIGGHIDIHTADHISLVMKDQSKRKRFIDDSISLASGFLFDGKSAVDIDAQDSTNDPLLRTAAVYHHPVIDINGGSFSYPSCDTMLNWINVLAIDFYTPSNSSGNTGPVHGWSTLSEDSNNCGKDGIEQWIKNGVASKNLVLGFPFYGYEWILANANTSGFFAPAHPANTNPMTYRDIKRKLKNYVTQYDNNYIAPYAYNSHKSWIGYENEYSIRDKVDKPIHEYGLRGYFAWHVGADDEDWTLSTEASKAIGTARRG